MEAEADTQRQGALLIAGKEIFHEAVLKTSSVFLSEI